MVDFLTLDLINNVGGLGWKLEWARLGVIRVMGVLVN